MSFGDEVPELEPAPVPRLVVATPAQDAAARALERTLEGAAGRVVPAARYEAEADDFAL